MWEPQALRYFRGSVSAPGRLTPPYGLPRMIVFVHGYNNDRAQATESYNALMARLSSTDQDAVWTLFWPGYVERITGGATDTPLTLAPSDDERGTESNMVLSLPSYSAQVLKAPRVGAALGVFLEAMRPGSLIFIAHSLGCRVALEAVGYLTRPGGQQTTTLSGACLMAAAVPTYMVDAAQAHWYRGPTGGQFVIAARKIERSVVLHSTRDRILQGAFPPGQTAAGEGVMPEAVGRHGRPRLAWSARGDTGLGHSGYWTHPGTAPAAMRVMGRGALRELLVLNGVQGVTWTLATTPAPPVRSMVQRIWRWRGTRQTLTGS